MKHIIYLHPHFTIPWWAGNYVLETAKRIAKESWYKVHIVSWKQDKKIIWWYDNIDFKEVDKIKEKQDDYCRNFNLLLNNMGVGKKRKTNESKKYEAKFIYKFNEGITDCVRRPLDINYFYTN